MSPLNTDQVRRFRRCLRQFERLSADQLKKCCTEVTFAQCLVLLEIDESDRPTLSELAAGLHLDNSTLSRSIDGLVGKGMVERVPDDSDRRRVRIALTVEGQRLCHSIHLDNDACVQRLFERIPPTERQSVVNNFELLVAAFLDWEASDDSSCCGSGCEPTGASSA